MSRSMRRRAPSARAPTQGRAAPSNAAKRVALKKGSRGRLPSPLHPSRLHSTQAARTRQLVAARFGTLHPEIGKSSRASRGGVSEDLHTEKKRYQCRNAAV